MSPRRIVSIVLLIAALLLLVDVGGVLLRPSSPVRPAPALPGLRARPVAPHEARVTQTASPRAEGGAATLTPNPGSTAVPQSVPARPGPVDPATALPMEPVVALPALHSPVVVIQRVATTRPYVAITVDDFYTGNYQRQTAIRQLQAANVLHAQLTLCPAGSALVAYTKKEPAQAQAIKQLVAAGSYEFCDHTYSHPVMPTLGVPAQTQEMLKGAAAIRAFFGRPPLPVFRPPFGSWDGSTQRAAAAAGFPRIVTWSVDTGDSVGPERPAEELVAHAARAQAGDIILLHANRRSSAVALPLIITRLRAKGLEPVLLSTLLTSGTPVYVTRPPARRPAGAARHAPPPHPDKRDQTLIAVGHS